MDNTSYSQELIFIGQHKIGKKQPTFIIAEIAQVHDGSLGMAHAYIDAVAKTGADAIKFQTHFAAEESTLDEPFRIKFSFQDKTRYDYWKRMEFTAEQWSGLAKHAKECDLVFLSSPFSEKAVRILRDIGMPAWKIGSGEINSVELLETMAENGAPILLSTGMSNINEIESCVHRIKQNGLQFAILQCTSMYPTPLEQVGLNVIEEVRHRFKCPVGLSDHSGSVFPGLSAMANHVDILEVHVTFDKHLFGPDVVASVTIDELSFLVEANQSFHTMFCNPVDKDAAATSMSEIKSLFTKSFVPVRALPAGTVLQSDMLTLKKPGTGIPAEELKNLIGRRLICDVTPDKLLKLEDLE